MPTTEGQQFNPIDLRLIELMLLDPRGGSAGRKVLTLLADLKARCAREAERIWDSGQEGAHGGEQCIRTADAIRDLPLLAPDVVQR